MAIDEKARDVALGAFGQHVWDTRMEFVSINPETMERALEAYESAKCSDQPTGFNIRNDSTSAEVIIEPPAQKEIYEESGKLRERNVGVPTIVVKDKSADQVVKYRGKWAWVNPIPESSDSK